MGRSMDDQVRGYLDLVEHLAESLARIDPNEYDDMVQEGLIFVWLTLKKGKPVAKEHIENRMKGWLRYRRRQKRDMQADYNKILPMEDLRDVNAEVASVSPRVIAARLHPGGFPDAAE